MNQNKSTKYLKYAIGEIFLVVIGILIALQINNWNEIRKTNNQSVAYLNKIINDLKVDTSNLKVLITKSEKFKQNINKYWDYFNTSDSLNVSMGELLDSINNVESFYLKYYPVNKTFKDMESSGNSALLTDVQRDFLIKLAASQQELEIIIESYIDQAIAENQKSKQLLGFPENFYDKLKLNNTEDRQVQGLLHLHLNTEALYQLYTYVKSRGEAINKLSTEAIQLLENYNHD